MFVIIGVPFEDVVKRTARVRLGVTVAACDAGAVLRTARVRDAVVVVVTGVIVEGCVTVTGVVLPLLLIIVGSDAALGTVRFPIARDCFVDGDVMAAVVVIVARVP